MSKKTKNLPSNPYFIGRCQTFRKDSACDWGKLFGKEGLFSTINHYFRNMATKDSVDLPYWYGVQSCTSLLVNAAGRTGYSTLAGNSPLVEVSDSPINRSKAPDLYLVGNQDLVCKSVSHVININDIEYEDFDRDFGKTFENAIAKEANRVRAQSRTAHLEDQVSNSKNTYGIQFLFPRFKYSESRHDAYIDWHKNGEWPEWNGKLTHEKVAMFQMAMNPKYLESCIDEKSDWVYPMFYVLIHKIPSREVQYRRAA